MSELIRSFPLLFAVLGLALAACGDSSVGAPSPAASLSERTPSTADPDAPPTEPLIPDGRAVAESPRETSDRTEQVTVTQAAVVPSASPLPPTVTPTVTPVTITLAISTGGRAADVLSEMDGRIVVTSNWGGGNTTVWEISPASGTWRTLWSEPRWSRDWTFSPIGDRVAYKAQSPDAENGVSDRIVVRDLRPGAQPTTIATQSVSTSNLVAPVWSASGSAVLYGDAGASDYGVSIFDRCDYREVDLASGSDAVIWSGTHADFPMAGGCPSTYYWDSDSRRLAAFEYGFEQSLSGRIDVLDVPS